MNKEEWLEKLHNELIVKCGHDELLGQMNFEDMLVCTDRDGQTYQVVEHTPAEYEKNGLAGLLDKDALYKLSYDKLKQLAYDCESNAFYEDSSWNMDEEFDTFFYDLCVNENTLEALKDYLKIRVEFVELRAYNDSISVLLFDKDIDDREFIDYLEKVYSEWPVYCRVEGIPHYDEIFADCDGCYDYDKEKTVEDLTKQLSGIEDYKDCPEEVIKEFLEEELPEYPAYNY